VPRHLEREGGLRSFGFSVRPEPRTPKPRTCVGVDDLGSRGRGFRV